jgi:pimeloyl-ACP methyl ester carboxylesterase
MTRMAFPLAAFLAGCASVTETGPTYSRAGSGTPAVVFQAGLGDGKEIWDPVAHALAGEFTVFALDRPGTGANPSVEGPRDPCTIATEQRALLRAVGLQPPYLLVGHSLGGLYQYAYAKLYPADVAGIVLVDPTHPRNWEIVQQHAPEGAALIKGMKALAWRRIRAREFDDQTACLDTLETGTPLTRPARVLVSGRPAPMANPQYERSRLALARDWARMAGAPDVDMVRESSHYIQTEAPDAVIAAIREIARPAGAEASHATAPSAPTDRSVEFGNKPPLHLIPGKTSRADVQAAWGAPAESVRDGSRETWIYSDKPQETPLAISFIPVIGDIADAIDLINSVHGSHELIVHFDEHGLVSRYRLREVP